MLPVEFKKILCRPVEFKGQEPQENLGLFPFRVSRVGELRVVGVIGDGGNPFGKLYHSLQ